jgi:O-antigen/teichoic acid export membrane protein
MADSIEIASAAERPADHISTHHLRANIRTRTILGAIVSTGGHGGQLILTLAYNAVLARLLSPHEFGLVALAHVVAGFLQVFKDAGLSTATIQREDITHAQVSNLFWLNLAVGGAAMFSLVAMAPVIAWFFDQPDLVWITAALSVAFVLDALVVQHVALLNRQMRFTMVSAIEIGCVAAGFMVGVVTAFNGGGYWSLIVATLSTAALRVAAVWALSGWRPQRLTMRSGTRPLIRFGADLTLVGIVYTFVRGVDSVLVGRYLGSDAVGLYSRATALITQPLGRLILPIYSVIVPALSRLQMEPDRYRRAFLQVYEGLAIAALLFAGLLFPLASPLVRVILGQQWDAAVPILAALTPLIVCFPLTTAASWLLTSQGRGRELLLSGAVGATIMVGAFVIGLQYGVAGVAIANSASSLLVAVPLSFYIAGRVGPVTTRDLWSASIAHMPLYFSVLTPTWLVSEWFARGYSPFAELLLCTAIGGVAGAAALFSFSRSREALRRFLAQLRDLRSQHTPPPGVGLPG